MSGKQGEWRMAGVCEGECMGRCPGDESLTLTRGNPSVTKPTT